MAEGDSQSDILKFFMMIGKLKHMKRTGWVRNDVPECETIAGHMYRMGIMAFLFDDPSFGSLDKNRCIKMALVHDMAECIVGDITPFCGVSKEEKHKKEEEAMQKLSSLVGRKTGEEFLELFIEYEEQKTMEAKAVKDLDKFDMILQAFEYEELDENRSTKLQQFFDSTEGLFENPGVLKWVKELKRQRTIANEDSKS